MVVTNPDSEVNYSTIKDTFNSNEGYSAYVIQNKELGSYFTIRLPYFSNMEKSIEPQLKWLNCLI